MTLTQVLETAVRLVATEAASAPLALALAASALVIPGMVARRRQNRADVITALQAVRRYGAPRGFDELRIDLDNLQIALAPFPGLRRHGDLLEDLVLRGWHSSREHWEDADRDPGLLATALDADLDRAVDRLIKRIIKRVRRPLWQQGWASRREVQALAPVEDPRWTRRRERPSVDGGDVVVNPEVIYQTQAEKSQPDVSGSVIPMSTCWSEARHGVRDVRGHRPLTPR